jgi:hypothetical protein
MLAHSGRQGEYRVFDWVRSHVIEGGDVEMLWTIGIILLILWLVGLVTAHTFGGVIHALLIIALVVFVIRLIQGRRVV